MKNIDPHIYVRMYVQRTYVTLCYSTVFNYVHVFCRFCWHNNTIRCETRSRNKISRCKKVMVSLCIELCVVEMSKAMEICKCPCIKSRRKINAAYICIRAEISAPAMLSFASIRKDNAFARFSYDAVSLGTGWHRSFDIETSSFVRTGVGRRRGWVYDNNASGETDIDFPAEAGSDWWARGLRCKRSHREAHRGIGDLIDLDVYEDREDSIVPLVLIPISGCTSCDRFSMATTPIYGYTWPGSLSIYIRYH